MSSSEAQGTKYWKERDRNDPHSDWAKDGKDWIQEYWESQDHPHRRKAVDLIPKDAKSVLEVGCNSGPNLALIRNKKLAGIDPNADAIAFAREKLPDADLRVGSVLNLPWEKDSFDVVLADAALMYVSDGEIGTAMAEMDRVARKAIVIVDRAYDSMLGIVENCVWMRDYSKWLRCFGYYCEFMEVNEKLWPTSKNWQKHGYIFRGTK